MSTLVTKHAPDFTAAAVLANGEIADKFHLAEAIKILPPVTEGIRSVVFKVLFNALAENPGDD